MPKTKHHGWSSVSLGLWWARGGSPSEALHVFGVWGGLCYSRSLAWEDAVLLSVHVCGPVVVVFCTCSPRSPQL